MRPQRIEVEGFSAFRERAVVDFTDADLFAFVGPTGAGKSSVIDAMVFALYGSVPRYDSENLVHPVITQGAVEARVRLDFSVRGVDHTATRVVRRTKTGASTKEARLERGGPDQTSTVLADDAKGMTAAVCDLLGLDLEQFTKCVVLPQGAFATLLHDTKAKRQDLLVKLLDLGVYERIAAAARAEAKQAASRIELVDEQLSRSAHATDAAVTSAEDGLAAVDDVVAALDEAAPALAAFEDELRAAETELARLDASLVDLAGVVMPPDVADIAHQAQLAAGEASAAEAIEAATATEVGDAEQVRAGLPDAAVLHGHQRDHAALETASAKVDKGAALIAELDEQAASLRPDLDTTSAAARTAEQALERARVGNAAADVARHLHQGDDCPVCGNEITALVTFDAAELTAAQAACTAAVEAERQASAAWSDHESKLASYRARLDERTAERDDLVLRLAGAPPVAEIAETLVAITVAQQTLDDARRRDADARAAVKRARAAAAAASQRVTSARADYTTVRDTLTSLGPPPPTDDLGADWTDLVRWAADERDAVAGRRSETQRRRDDAAKLRSEQLTALVDRATAAGVPRRAPAQLRDACVTAAATARAQLRQLADERDRAAELRGGRADLETHRQVHELLADQLGARGFEAWLLDEALDALLVGASAWLEQLSSGRYAMTVDDKNQFAVVDHANADERRLARTLSGGETFLASLALALALAERVGELSVVGGTNLDAIFLDEGFGTLDPDTLDVVATAIEELGATGRMVGVISHVRELAERVPVRFEIAKGPVTSTVRRVDA